MAALSGAEIDNCEIRINGPEMPGFDGSAAPFFRLLKTAGTIEQPALRPMRVIRQTYRFGDENGGLVVRPSTTGRSLFSYTLQYAPPIGEQRFEIRLDPDAFEREVAPARTFLLRSEAEQLLALGLCRRVTERDVLVFGENGPVGNTLRFENEPARHKALDMIGDFALAGCALLGEFYATRTGHQQNADALAEILETTELI